MSTFEQRKHFYQAMLPDVQSVCAEDKVPFLVCMAQAALETGWGWASTQSRSGRSFEAIETSLAYNYFGIKGTGDAGHQLWDTKEYVGVPGTGALVDQKSWFAKYSSRKAAISAWVGVVTRPGDFKYMDAMRYADDEARFITWVWACGYATAPNYPTSIISVMNRIIVEAELAHPAITIDTKLEAALVKLRSVPAGSGRRKIRDELYKEGAF